MVFEQRTNSFLIHKTEQSDFPAHRAHLFEAFEKKLRELSTAKVPLARFVSTLHCAFPIVVYEMCSITTACDDISVCSPCCLSSDLQSWGFGPLLRQGT